MPSRAYLSEQAQEEERKDRDRLDEIDGKIRLLSHRRVALIDRVRELSAEQKKLFDARQTPQDLVERLHEEHRELGRTVARLRKERDTARSHLDELVARAREIRAEVAPGDRVHPERVRKEIADLVARQQTHALPLAEENALIDRVRERTRFLKELEAREAMLHEHERRRAEAEVAVRAGRAELERLTAESGRARAERDARMVSIRSELVRAGGVVAQIREKATARRDVMGKLDAIGRELDGLDREARGILAASRGRRDEAREAARAYSPRRGTARSDPSHTDHADQRLEELLKRGKITLG
ncbi:MAG: hypothetical protein ACREBT_00605 [Thermoplasmata archaeon]